MEMPVLRDESFKVWKTKAQAAQEGETMSRWKATSTNIINDVRRGVKQIYKQRNTYSWYNKICIQFTNYKIKIMSNWKPKRKPRKRKKE